MAVFQAAEPEITLFISPLGTSPLTLHAFRALRMTCACHSTLAASTGKLVQLSLQEALLVRLAMGLVTMAINQLAPRSVQDKLAPLVMHGQQLSVSQHHVRVLYRRFGGNGASHLGHSRLGPLSERVWRAS